MVFDLLKEKDLCAFEGPAVEVRNLTKLFGASKPSTRRIRGPSRRARWAPRPQRGGKTTIIHMLLGLTPRPRERSSCSGSTSPRHKEKILECVNFSSTYVSMPLSLTVIECLKVFARLYHVRRRREVIDELLETFEMTESRTNKSDISPPDNKPGSTWPRRSSTIPRSSFSTADGEPRSRHRR